MKAQVTVSRQVPMLPDEVEQFNQLNAFYAEIEDTFNPFLANLAGSDKQIAYVEKLANDVAFRIKKNNLFNVDREMLDLWAAVVEDMSFDKVGISTAIDTFKAIIIDIDDYKEHKATAVRLGRWGK